MQAKTGKYLIGLLAAALLLPAGTAAARWRSQDAALPAAEPAAQTAAGSTWIACTRICG